MLSTVEFCTPAVYHCTTSALEELDKVQRRFLHELGVSTEDALLKYNLAPLQTRRDIAMLGLMHRTVLGQSIQHFSEWFFPDALPQPAYTTRRQSRLHNRQLYDWLRTRDTELLRRSVLGLVRVYNELPQEAVSLNTVKAFQHWLQNTVKAAARRGAENWENLLNLRKRSWKQTKS